MNWHLAAQCWIVCFSLGAAWLTTSRYVGQRKWGFILGLCSQPAWFYATITAEQWGQVFMACIYTLVWIRGIRNNWGWKTTYIKRRDEHERLCD